MKIYTKGGDKGRTSIFGGERVEKDNIRVETNGEIDELNTVIGIVRAHLPQDHEWQELLFGIQTEMMSVMSHVATPSSKRVSNPNSITEDFTLSLEGYIDELTEKMGENNHFILPGGTKVSSFLHLARTTARRCERRLCTLNREDSLPEGVISFVNRLSDLFFVMSRYDLYVNGINEERWKSFGYKRGK